MQTQTIATHSTLTHCTLTGVDNSTDIDQLFVLADRFPFVEWGTLYSESQAGNGRYPDLSKINTIVRRLGDAHARPAFALHVCGRAVADFLAGVGHVSEVAGAFDRIQINFLSSRFSLQDIIATVRRYPSKTIITQLNAANIDLWKHLADEPNHAVLFDASCGRGIERDEWPAGLPSVRCGYAGGLGPDNVSIHLPRIQYTAGNAPFWIDMEGRLRDEHDVFDLARAAAVLDHVERWHSAQGDL
ncbi:hypothetical protein ACXIVK_27820 [Paraburkholderia caledonica]|jgi:hypothetical protein